MEKLKAAFRFGGILSSEETAIITSYFEEKKLQAEEDFLSIGKAAGKIGFIDTGIIRAYVVDTNGDEVTTYFYRENQFIADLESYYGRKPATTALQAVVDSIIFSVNRKQWEELTERIPKLFILMKSLAEATLLNKIKDKDFLSFGTATDKYKEFVKRNPEFALHIPQQYIASYLGITPQSLSRIRKRITS